MDFILITLIIMSVSVIIIYKLTSLCGIRLQLKALALCAFCALVVNFTALTISAYLTRGHFYLIAGLVIVSATAVTVYNEKLLRQAAPVPIPADKIRPEPIPTAAIVPESVIEPPSANLIGSKPLSETITAPKPATTAAAVTAMPEPVRRLTPINNVPRKNLYTRHTTWTAYKKPESNKKLPIMQKNEPAAPHHYLPALCIRTVADIVREDMENDQLLKLTAVIAKLGSLDALLDYAFDQQTRHNHQNAIFAYKQALIRYRADPYAPFIAIELGNIYKNNGAYEEAVHTYKNAFSLPAVQADGNMQAKSSNTMTYLQSIQFILAKHNTCRLPFASISSERLAEIETCFQKKSQKKFVS